MRRIILGFLTLLVVLVSVGPALISSLTEPQIANQLEIYQSDLLLQASELEPPEGFDVDDLSVVLGGDASLEQVTEQYETTLLSVQANLNRLETQVQANASDQTVLSDELSSGELQSPNSPEDSTVPVDPSAPTPNSRTLVSPLEKSIRQQQILENDLGLRLGILYAVQDRDSKAIATWESIAEESITEEFTTEPVSSRLLPPSKKMVDQAETAQILMGLWTTPAQILPNAEPQLRRTLTGWFRFRGLEQLYQLQQRLDDLDTLYAQEQEQAQATLVKLGLLGVGPALGCLIGIVLLVVLIFQRVTKGKESLLAGESMPDWVTPWPWEITWQVLIVGFFFLGQIVLPIVVSVMRNKLMQIWMEQGVLLSLPDGRVTAFTTAFIYLLMAIASILVLYFSIRTYLPLPDGWFHVSLKGRWILWGLGGYFCAVPLVIGVSLLNQQIWQGRGGSNPLLEIVLNEGDMLSLGIFFFTAAVAAPIFEEILFRGFLLPSLTRYMPIWGAIALSSLIFATAHLSFSEVLPLTILGIVLGFVYTRSQNLLASMMVHSLWNSATMVGLLILGSSID